MKLVKPLLTVLALCVAFRAGMHYSTVTLVEVPTPGCHYSQRWLRVWPNFLFTQPDNDVMDL